MLNTTGMGAPTRLYPHSVLVLPDPVIVTGGEFDALSAISEGFCAITGTNGEGSVAVTDLEHLRGRVVALALDNDPAGREAAAKWAAKLDGVASQVRLLTLPREGMDLNDLFRAEVGAGAILQDLIECAPIYGVQRDEGELVVMAISQAHEGASRNAAGFWLASQLRDERYSEEAAWDSMAAFQAAVENDKSPAYTEQEARSSLASAFAAPPRRPSGRGPHRGDTAHVFSRTELGNAERFVARHGNDCRYLPALRRWLVWDSRHWIDDETGATERWAKQTARSIRTNAFNLEDPDEQKWELKWAHASESAARLSAMLRLAQSEANIAMLPVQFDSDPDVLNVRNGTINLRTGQLSAHRREDYHRRLVDIAYDPEARSPRFDAFLRQVQPDPEMRAFLQRAVGYSLTGRTDEQRFLLLHGTGANGKTTLVELLHDVSGEYATFLPADAIAQTSGDRIPNDIARLDGRRFVSVMEFEDGKPLNERLIKQLTGGDTMQARFMRAEFFDFRPQCTLWVSSNHRPVVKNNDDGIWRRFLLVNFPVQIAKADIDPKLRERIRATELPGILHWAVEGARAWYRQGLDAPASVRSATDEYRVDSDVLGAFLVEETAGGTDQTTTKAEIYERYVGWCDSGGLRPMTKISFGRALKERPELSITSDEIGKAKVHVWVGIGLRDRPTRVVLSAVTPIRDGADVAGQSAAADLNDASTARRKRRRP